MSKTLTNNDYCRAAKRLACEVAAIKAVDDTESKGKGFYPNGFPVILFERHKFRKYTGGRYNKTHPHLSGSAGNYGKQGQNQINKFNEAFALDPTAAMQSCSWGRYQIMGFNHRACGYATVREFVDAMKESEGKHLDAFVGFIISEHLADELRRHDWKGFAEAYNGAGYKDNRYDTKMAKAYAKYAKEKIDCNKVLTTAAPNPEIKTEPSVSSHGESTPSPSQGSQAAPVGNLTPSSDVPVEVKKETTPLFMKISVVVTTLIGMGFQIGEVATAKLKELTPGQIGYLLGVLGLVGLVGYFYHRSAERANKRTENLINAAADKQSNTVTLT